MDTQTMIQLNTNYCAHCHNVNTLCRVSKYELVKIDVLLMQCHVAMFQNVRDV